jgi:hypothetical protein
MPKIAHFRAVCLGLAAVACSGLSCNKQEALNPVEGKVLYQNAPLTGALVSFHPQGTGAESRDRSTGLTKEDGTFSLNTGQIQGAPAGDYVVTVICPVPVKTESQGMSVGGEAETEDRLQGAYASPHSSQIKVTIEEGPNQLEPFELQ